MNTKLLPFALVAALLAAHREAARDFAPA